MYRARTPCAAAGIGPQSRSLVDHAVLHHLSRVRSKFVGGTLPGSRFCLAQGAGFHCAPRGGDIIADPGRDELARALPCGGEMCICGGGIPKR